MDSLIIAAARALAVGDPLAALKRVALREDASALALRGIAMAQLGDLDRAKTLLKSAIAAFPPQEGMACARCIVAQAEIALVSRDLSWSPQALDAAYVTLQEHGDRINAAYATILAARRHLLTGRIDDAERALTQADPAALPPATRAVHQLVAAGIAVRRIEAAPASAAFAAALASAQQARIPALLAEIETAAKVLDAPAARSISPAGQSTLTLAGVQAVLASGALIIDAIRNVVRHRQSGLPLASRPVLFALLRALGEAWPGDMSREQLVSKAFGGREADESHRARLRVEIGRLRTALADLATITATKTGFILQPHQADTVIVLAPPRDDPHARVLALLADGEAWSSSALALALSTSPRTVQRALEQLAREQKVHSFGSGRALRWISPPIPGFPTALLLPGPLP